MVSFFPALHVFLLVSFFRPASSLAELRSTGTRAGPSDGQYLRLAAAPVKKDVKAAEVPGSIRAVGPADSHEVKISKGSVWHETFQKAFKGGVAGLLTGACQVLVFMWLRTIMNHQYARGGDMVSTAKQLYQEGGIMRFYRGISLALIESPLTRFGDTFANIAVMTSLASVPVNPLAKTIFTSFAASCWRLAIMPLDTCKTVLQVQGDGAFDMLRQKVRDGGMLVLWTGALANFAANCAGSYPWWATYNSLDTVWQEPVDEYQKIVRNGIMGMSASIVSDCVSNSFRVIKTYTQANPDPKDGYGHTLSKIISAEGVSGLLFRGLGTRLLCNVLQGTFFAIVWQCIQRQMH